MSVDGQYEVSVDGQYSDTLVKSYRYLRSAMVGLVICLAAAVVYQTLHQEFLLDSISAYYYTPAQAIFVGALIAIGVCMVALKGTTDTEDLLLNIGGMLAPVVAIVPTARGEDYRTALAACRNSETSVLTERASGNADCPSIQALADATSANVENNMVALLVVGALGLLATFVFARIDQIKDSRDGKDRGLGSKFWWGFGAAGAVYVVVAVSFAVLTEQFIDTAHYVAAIGFFAFIVAVVVVNALRRQGLRLSKTQGLGMKAGTVLSALFRSPDRYSWLAHAMLAVALLGVLLLVTGIITVFWLEAGLIALFAVFWVVQTKDRWDDETLPVAGG